MPVDFSAHCPNVLRWANGVHDEKPLSVPRDAHLQLETCPLTAVDALGNPTQSLVPSPAAGVILPGWLGSGEPGAGG